MADIKLSDVTKPTLKVELPDGEVKSYDLYKLAAGLQPVMRDLSNDLPAYYDGIRKVFGFPPESEANGAFTLEYEMCQILALEVIERVQKLPEQKRFFALASAVSALSTSASQAK